MLLGLTSLEAARRLQRHGPNDLVPVQRGGSRKTPQTCNRLRRARWASFNAYRPDLIEHRTLNRNCGDALLWACVMVTSEIAGL